jgi:hypothetical protein
MWKRQLGQNTTERQLKKILMGFGGKNLTKFFNSPEKNK